MNPNNIDLFGTRELPEITAGLLDAAADARQVGRHDQMREAVAITAGHAVLEASGGLTLETAAAVAATGVDTIAVGALTHSAKVMDIAMDLRSS